MQKIPVVSPCVFNWKGWKVSIEEFLSRKETRSMVRLIRKDSGTVWEGTFPGKVLLTGASNIREIRTTIGTLTIGSGNNVVSWLSNRRIVEGMEVEK